MFLCQVLAIDEFNIILYQPPVPVNRGGMTFLSSLEVHGRKRETFMTHNHSLHDVELLDDAGLKDPRNQIINAD